MDDGARNGTRTGKQERGREAGAVENGEVNSRGSILSSRGC